MEQPALDEFLDELAQVATHTTTDDVWAFISSFFARHGFDRLIYIDLKPDRLMLLSTLPAAWVARYHDQNYAQIDPFFSHCGTTYRPISTGAAYLDQHTSLSREQRGLISEAAEFGINAGFSSTVQIMGRKGFSGWNIGSSLSRKDVDGLRSDREAMLRLAARHAHDVLMQAGAIPGKKILSPRELECMTLLAQGQRTKDIARSLSISTAAVELYLRNARRKLGATTREQSVAEATARGMLSI